MCHLGVQQAQCPQDHELQVGSRIIIQCTNSNEHADDDGFDTTSPEWLDGPGVVDSADCSLCIWQEILGSRTETQLSAEYLKLTWRISETRRLSKALERSKQEASDQATAYIEAIYDECSSEALINLLRNSKDAAVVIWRRAWNQAMAANILLKDLKIAQAMCRDIELERCQPWITDSHILQRYDTNSRRILTYLRKFGLATELCHATTGREKML